MARLFLCLIVSLYLLLGILGGRPSLAFTGYEYGVTDTKEYKEVVFLNGQPLIFKGTVKESTSEKNNVVTTTLSYKLTGPNKGDTISRTVKLESTKTQNDNQEVYTTRLTGISESLALSGQRYKLNKDGVFFSSTKVVDRKPVVDYITETWNYKKVYEAGKAVYTVTIEASGSSQGYANAWGKGTTTTSLAQITYSKPSDGQVIGEGQVKTVMSSSYNRNLRYVPSKVDLSSFSGGYVDEAYTEENLKASYDLPVLSSSGERSKGEVSLAMVSPPQQRHLFIREFRDVRNHWARPSIEAMCGLGAFDNQGTMFGPGLAARRIDLAQGLAQVCGLVSQDTGKKINTKTKGKEVHEPVFFDVPPDSPKYKYVKEVYQRGILLGTAYGLFEPGREVTRAEAITALVRALGLGRLAPVAKSDTGFLDDGEIPLWAKDSVMVAKELGLVKGDGGYFRPSDVMTRAELATLLDQLRLYLNREFNKDYREHLYNYG